MKLRTSLRKFLEGWEQDLPAAWRKAIGETQLNWNNRALDCEVQSDELIFPGRKKLFRAFSKISPRDVRAVIVGQDPYPNPAWATGRAFEQGDLEEWPERRRQVADSLRRLVQAVVAARTQNQAYATNDGAWKKLIHDAGRGQLPLESPRELFDHLEGEGVLLLNTSLTIGVVHRAGQRKAFHRHFQLWAPFTYRVLTSIAGRPGGHAVFLLLGRQAERVFARSRARTVAERAGAWKTRVDTVCHAHPAAIDAGGPSFLRPPNPFVVANQRLQEMGAAPVRW